MSRRLVPSARLAPFSLVASMLLAAPATAGVITVSQAGGADFTQISAAVAAAQEADVILVEPPAAYAYDAFTVDGRSLTISVAHDGDLVRTRHITIQNLAAGQTCVLRGFVVVPVNLNYGLFVEDCEGAVRVERCRLVGTSAEHLFILGADGIRALSAADLGITACELVGGAGWTSTSSDWDATMGGYGLRLMGGRAWVHDSVLTGGNGGWHTDSDPLSGSHFQPGNGGAGVFLGQGAELSLSGCTLRGGDSGQQIADLDFGLAGPGLYGLGGTLLHLRDSVLESGSDTAPHSEVPPLWMRPDDVQQLHAEARHLSNSSPVREHETLHLLVDGQRGDLALLIPGLGTQGQWFPALAGPLLVDPSAGAPFVLGSIPSTGRLAADIPVPALPAGVEALVVHLQLAIANAEALTLENASTVVLLDAAF